MARRVKAAFKFKPFSRQQKRVLTWWMASSPYSDYDGVIADGSIRSGKTVSMSLSYVIWAMSSYDGQNFGMAGKTIGSFRRNVLFWLKLMLLSRGYKVKDHRADNMVEVSWTIKDTDGNPETKVNYFYIFGGKDERSQDLIQGITLAGMFFDEVALMPESFVNQATSRCSVEGSKWWFNCNPDGPYHFFKLNWIDKVDDKRILYLHFTMDDNLSLSDHIKQRYKGMYTGVFFKRYILGLWAVAEGIIYDMFDEERHVYDQPISFKSGAKNYISIDYGTQNATVFLLWRQGTDNRWYCDKEYYYSGRDKAKQKTDTEYADDLDSFVQGIKIDKVIIDPSAASFIAELKKRGYSIKKAKNNVIDGIRFVGTLLNEDKIKVSAECSNTIKEFASYLWDSKAIERGEDKPVKQHDHAMDGLRYFCYTMLRKKGGISFMS